MSLLLHELRELPHHHLLDEIVEVRVGGLLLPHLYHGHPHVMPLSPRGRSSGYGHGLQLQCVTVLGVDIENGADFAVAPPYPSPQVVPGEVVSLELRVTDAPMDPLHLEGYVNVGLLDVTGQLVKRDLDGTIHEVLWRHRQGLAHLLVPEGGRREYAVPVLLLDLYLRQLRKKQDSLNKQCVDEKAKRGRWTKERRETATNRG